MNSCSSSCDAITLSGFGQTSNGESVELYTLRNRRGMRAQIATYGGIVTSLTAPDRHGDFADIVLGFDSFTPYLSNTPYFGTLIGRYANRIAGGRFALDGVQYVLATNDGPNALHGGVKGFDRVVWQVRSAAVTPMGPRLELAYRSADGEEGYPGNLDVTAAYTLTADHALRLDCIARTDQHTIVNLSQHSYFNLRGSGDVYGHEMQINADRFTPINRVLIPTGELRSVGGTAFDFRHPSPIGARLGAPDEQLQFARGYDHNFVMNKPANALALMATVHEPESGRIMEVSSTEPGLQFYSGNFLDGSIIGKGGRAYERGSGFAMEPQHFPDSPNHAHFPTTELKPGQTYRNTIIYRFFRAVTRARDASRAATRRRWNH